MISVITCWKRPEAQTIQERNIQKTIGTAFEYIMIDGSSGISLAAAYNQGIAQAQGDIVVFVPEDVLFMKPNWGTVLEHKFATDPWLGMVGVAGSQFLYSDKYSWTAAGRPFIKGRIVQHLENGDFFAVVFSNENGDFPVIVCDGTFMAVKAAVFQTAIFDEQVFNGSYFYDLDFCMQINRNYRLIISTEIVIKKRSQNAFDKVWNYYGEQFLIKHAASLPLSCADALPDPNNFISSQVVNLKGKAPIETIC
jgi:hypothetical protein